jgi:hypothetical protein
VRVVPLNPIVTHHHHASSATAGSDVTASSFVTGALRELSVILAKRNEVVYRGALHVYATAGGTAARAGAMVLTVESN